MIAPPSASPFAPALDTHAECLPLAFREQFMLVPEHPYAVVFEGRMDSVWRRHRWLWPIFWLLTRSNLLFPETGTDVPATMTIAADRDGGGVPCQRWSRTFAFARPRHFDATMGYDPERRQIVEWFGRTGRLEIAWDVRFQPPDTIEIATRGATLRFGGRRLAIPRPLCVAVHAVERADCARDDTITIDLRLSAPLLGTIFGYNGTFRLRRVACSRQNGEDSDATPDAC